MAVVYVPRGRAAVVRFAAQRIMNASSSLMSYTLLASAPPLLGFCTRDVTFCGDRGLALVWCATMIPGLG